MKNIYILLAVCSMALFSSCGFNVFDDVYQTEQTSDNVIFDENGYPIYQDGRVVVLDRNDSRNRRSTRTTRGSRDGGYNGCPGEQPQSRPRVPQQRQPQTTPRPRPQPQSTPRPRPQPQQQNARPAPTQSKSTSFSKPARPNNN